MINLMPYLADLNLLTDGWIDSSYGNDACQSVAIAYSDDTRLKVYIDASLPCEREYDTGKQYTVVFESDDGDNEVMLVTDDWYAVLSCVAESHDVSLIDAFKSI